MAGTKARLARAGLILTGGLIVIAANYGLDYTSTNAFCDSCHVHPQSTMSFRRGPHGDTRSGVSASCTSCHLPPAGVARLTEKVRSGVRDVYGTLFKDTANINWLSRSTREAAERFTFEDACTACHTNLFPRELGEKGTKAHLHYEESEGLRCINCHLDAGHEQEPSLQIDAEADSESERPIYAAPASVDGFVNFEEQIPGTRIGFAMVAVPGGTFMMGSPQDEPGRRSDEGPRREVEVERFWMGRAEVSWELFDAYYRETAAQGRTGDQQPGPQGIDAVTGPTPAYGNPDQGWGRGSLPAITMTRHAAIRFCEWLSRRTGRRYRLPTEAEWEYAARGGTNAAYFFGGDATDYEKPGFLGQLFGSSSSTIMEFVNFAGRGEAQTLPPNAVKENPFGLVHMLGNVREFCLDPYVPDAYGRSKPASTTAAAGPFVIRGGSFKSPAPDVRAAARDRTDPAAWLRTDPQMPKSIWWYSDVNDVGFRVVCEYPGSGS